MTKILNLSKNAIRYIDDEIFLKNLVPRLEKIDLSYNLLQTLPAIFFKAGERLKQLDLSHNMLEDLSDNISLLRNLDVLHIHANRFKRLPSTLSQLPLRTLSLDWFNYQKKPTNHQLTDSRLISFLERLANQKNGYLHISDIIDTNELANLSLSNKSMFYKALVAGDIAVLDLALLANENFLKLTTEDGYCPYNLAIKSNSITSFEVLIEKKEQFNHCRLI